MRCSARAKREWCTADPGPPRTVTVPGLQRITPRSRASCRAAPGTRLGPAVLSANILIPAILNGLLTGAVYALVALGLTLIYGVLHIINFAHGALLTAAMFAAFFAHRLFGLDPYVAALALTPLFFLLGYGLQRFVIGPAAHGEDRNVL